MAGETNLMKANEVFDCFFCIVDVDGVNLSHFCLIFDVFSNSNICEVGYIQSNVVLNWSN